MNVGVLVGLLLRLKNLASPPTKTHHHHKETEMKNTTTKPTSQTTRMNGKRVVIRTSATGRVTVTDAEPREADLQAAQVSALRSMPEYGKRFLLAADMNAERRGPKARVMAVATGMTAGEPDLRLYLDGGKLRMIENKTGKGKLSPAQVDRHAALARLGHVVEVVRANTTEQASAAAIKLVRDWLSEDNSYFHNYGT